MSQRSAKFEFRDEFREFLRQNGVSRAASNYITWMNRASANLGRRIGPLDLTCAADVERMLDGFRPPFSRDYHMGHLASVLRKYAAMVEGNYRGLFPNVPAAPAPVANDADNKGVPARVKQTVHRIVRDTEIARKVKRLYDFHCQVCGERLELAPGHFYAEAHHLRPLGGAHKGKDVEENLLCLCPNHHALFDYFAIMLDPAKLKLKCHALGTEFVAYHNARVSTREP